MATRRSIRTSRVDYLANITGQFNIVRAVPRGRIIHHSQVPISSPRAELIDYRSLCRPSVRPSLDAYRPQSRAAGRPGHLQGLRGQACVRIMMAIDDA